MASSSGDAPPVTIDLCRDDSSNGNPSPLTPLHGSADEHRKRRRRQSEEGIEEEEEAQFSDGEEDAPALAPAPQGTDGFDFSRAVCADAAQPNCPLCGKPFEPIWDAERHELVIENAAMLRHVIFHSACVLTRRGPLVRPERSRPQQG